jgi:hypothetical protein
MTLERLQQIVAERPEAIAERLTLAIALNPEGWITWLALQSDAAGTSR